MGLDVNLIPSFQEELVLIRTYAESKYSELSDLVFDSNILFHDQSKRMLKLIDSGLNPELPDEKYTNDSAVMDLCFAHPNLSQCNYHIIPKLEELHERRIKFIEASEAIQAVIDTSIPLEAKSSVRDLRMGLESVEVDAKANRNGILAGCWPELESITGGLRLGQVFGIAGESECGKTTFVKNWLHNINLNTAGIKTAVISLEESEEDFVQSIVCMTLGMSRKELIWTINNKPGFDVKKVYEDYSGWKNTVFNYDAYTLPDIEGFVKRHKPHVVLLDHAQFIRHDPKIGLGQWIFHLCNTLKRIAKENLCCFLLLSQIDKDSAKTHGTGKQATKRIPTLADAWGGIGFKSGLDAGFVICRDKNSSMIYCDKCRKPWDIEYRYSKFNMYVDGGKQLITGISPKFEQDEQTETSWWDK